MTTHIGIESRVAADGGEHAWRLVAFNDRMPGTTRAWHGSIPETVYVREPRDPLHGDLTDLGPSLVEQAGEISGHLAPLAPKGIDVGAHHEDLDVIQAIRDHGVAVTAVETPIPVPGELEDTHAIGGYAGHDIAALARLSESAE